MSSQSSHKNELKIILVGNMSVGKTCIVHSYANGKFKEKVPPTLVSNFTNVIKEFNNQEYSLNIWDTEGQEKYNSLTKSFVKSAKIAILVYSIIDKNHLTI